MKKVFLYGFLLAALVELAAVVFGWQGLQYGSKPLIMIMLGGYYLTSVARLYRSNALLGAILFSFTGDTLLLFVHYAGTFFITGLLAFLVAHVFYILTYRQHQWEETEDKLQGIHKIRFAFPVILVGTGLMIVLYPLLGDLKIPVLGYTLVLVLMVLNALFRYGRTSTKSFAYVFSGAILFMISDSVLAINKFLQPVNHAVFLIMITYSVAQFLIIQGLIEHPKKD